MINMYMDSSMVSLPHLVYLISPLSNRCTQAGSKKRRKGTRSIIRLLPGLHERGLVRVKNIPPDRQVRSVSDLFFLMLP